MKDKNGSILTPSLPLQSVATKSIERERPYRCYLKNCCSLSLSFSFCIYFSHSFILFLSSTFSWLYYLLIVPDDTCFLIDLFTSVMSMNRIKSKLDSVRICGKDEGMSMDRMSRKWRWISFTADTRGQQVQPYSNSQQLICDKCSAISPKNKCSYAYDNLAYGFSKDQRQISEQWNKASNTYLLLTHLFHCYCSMPEKHLNRLHTDKKSIESRRNQSRQRDNQV